MKSRISCCLNMSIAFKLLNKIVLDMTQLEMRQLNFNNVKNFYDEIIFLKKSSDLVFLKRQTLKNRETWIRLSGAS